VKKLISTYRPKTREDNSNPFRSASHNDLLKRSDVHIYKGNVNIQTLKNGRIIVESCKK
jgi:hypothetical protein